VTDDGTPSASSDQTFTITVMAVNDAPYEFSLISPDGDTLLIDTENLADSTLFSWNSAEDVDDDDITYDFVSTASIGSEQFGDTTISAGIDTSVYVLHQEIKEKYSTYFTPHNSYISIEWFVIASDTSGATTNSSGTFTVVFEFTEGTLANEELVALPEHFILYQNYPNPFNPVTFIAYDLPERTEVAVSIYTLSGQLVRQFNPGVYGPGHYRLSWNGLNDRGNRISAGVYLYRIRAGTFVKTKKMVLLK